MEKSCFVVGLCCVSRVFCPNASPSATLQSHNVDLSQCIKHVDRVFNEAKAMRNDAVSGFSSPFVEAQEMATSIGCEIRASRQCGRKSIGIHMEHRIRKHIIDCPHIYPSLICLNTSFRIDFSNIAAYCAASAPCYRTALQRKEQKQDRSAARSKTSTRRIFRLPRWTRSKPSCICGRDFGEKKKLGETTPQLCRKLELLRCSHFPVCLQRNKNCGMYFSDCRNCRAIVLHIEETKNLPEGYNGQGAPQRVCNKQLS